ncbi:cupin domain-containing protein [Nodosilinea sp. PGN35]|uniref:cupin domain-containing protein n=1 Tax=Nodosilinea sp. PGN35 TaxID=3020489 RepID=UPI0023B32F9F|nr:cupin domain-containing protein [Nodosilinea sp. TSF1-S3]MDF0370005.1 cupin domain-containing protein [Nodosilinea sp. TSF1-S3]
MPSAPKPDNLFELPAPLPEAESFSALFETPHLRVERILSSGQTTPPGQWYDQSQNEWVVLLQGSATLTYEDGAAIALGPGDYLLIPAHVRHRVDFTSREPPCVWLAIHSSG